MVVPPSHDDVPEADWLEQPVVESLDDGELRQAGGGTGSRTALAARILPAGSVPVKGSLLVVLDGPLGAHRGLVRVPPGVAPRTSLPQEVPALIEGDLQVVEALLLLIGEARSHVGFLESAFLLGQLVDAGDELGIVHGTVHSVI